MLNWCFVSHEPDVYFFFYKEKDILYQNSVIEDNEMMEIPNSKRSFICYKDLIISWCFYEAAFCL